MIKESFYNLAYDFLNLFPVEFQVIMFMFYFMVVIFVSIAILIHIKFRHKHIILPLMIMLVVFLWYFIEACVSVSRDNPQTTTTENTYNNNMIIDNKTIICDCIIIETKKLTTYPWSFQNPHEEIIIKIKENK